MLCSTPTGRLLGQNLFDRGANPSPLAIAVGATGSGKSVFVACIINSALATLREARVRAVDFGESFGPHVDVLEGRHLRFNIASAERSPYSESLELNFIVDGERVRGAKAKVARSYNPAPLLAPDLKLAEDIIAFVNIDAIREVVGGKKVEMQLGSTELTLDATTLNNLRKFASSVFGK